MKFRNDIQGLRAVAVFLVFIFHLQKSWLPGGFVGVDVFFVISGFLITTIIRKKILKKSFSLKEFYLSRISRIVPAYYFMVLIVSIASLFVYLNFDIEKILRKELIYVLGFASNNYFATLGTYFGASLFENPFLHTWTLGIEMQFYFFLPFLLLIFRKNKNTKFAIIALTISLLCYGTYMLYVEKESSSTYFSLLARMPEFLFGSLVSFARQDLFNKRKLTANIFSFIGLGLILFSSFFYSEHTPFPGFTAIVPCLGTAILILTTDSFINKQLASKVPKFIGEISYSIYLWHWPIMALTRYFYSIENFSTVQIIMVVLLTIITSIISYYAIENKIRSVNKLNLLKFLVPIFGICLIFPLLAKKISDRIYNLPEEFVQPTFGINSHNLERTETLGEVKSPDSTIFLTGNSHALVLKKYLDYMGLVNKFSFKTITSDAYPPFKLNKDSLIEDGNFKNSYYVMSQKLQPIATSQIKNCELIFIAISDNILSKNSIQKAIYRIADSLTQHQKMVIFKTFITINDNPIKIDRGITKTSHHEFRIIPQPSVVDSFLTTIQQRNNNVRVFDLTNSSIYKEIPYKNDSALYYNEGHLNTFGTLKLAEDQRKAFSVFFEELKK